MNVSFSFEIEGGCSGLMFFSFTPPVCLQCKLRLDTVSLSACDPNGTASFTLIFTEAPSPGTIRFIFLNETADQLNLLVPTGVKTVSETAGCVTWTATFPVSWSFSLCSGATP